MSLMDKESLASTTSPDRLGNTVPDEKPHRNINVINNGKSTLELFWQWGSRMALSFAKLLGRWWRNSCRFRRTGACDHGDL